MQKWYFSKTILQAISKPDCIARLDFEEIGRELDAPMYRVTLPARDHPFGLNR